MLHPSVHKWLTIPNDFFLAYTVISLFSTWDNSFPNRPAQQEKINLLLTFECQTFSSHWTATCIKKDTGLYKLDEDMKITYLPKLL